MFPSQDHGISTEISLKWKRYAAGGPYDLVAEAGMPCRAILVLVDGDLTHAVDVDSVDRPIAGLKAGMCVPIACSSITPTAALLVLW